uniref:C2H2-type domain-containing protein n=1 Tax=Timema monikensis TaxID=170555 RepID=A0A7R9EI41_9NEOP|nr:unnamed protein product [Timema monikensis]
MAVQACHNRLSYDQRSTTDHCHGPGQWLEKTCKMYQNRRLDGFIFNYHICYHHLCTHSIDSKSPGATLGSTNHLYPATYFHANQMPRCVVQNIHLLSVPHGHQQFISVNYRAEPGAQIFSLVSTTLLSQMCELEPPNLQAELRNITIAASGVLAINASLLHYFQSPFFDELREWSSFTMFFRSRSFVLESGVFVIHDSFYAFNEPDCDSTQLKLESTIESILHSIIKPEKTSTEPASGVCEELRFKEELCFDESSTDVSENNKIQFGQNFINEIHKNVYLSVMDDQIMDTTFLNNELNLYQKNREQYNCDDYNKSYTKNINIKSHLLTQSEQRPYKCDICSKYFKIKSILKTHLISHGEHRPHKCGFCGRCFKLNNTLKNHLVTHREKRPYKCDICSKNFKNKTILKTHLVTHGEHRPHKCDVCGKLFKLNKSLKSHLITHGEHRPHKCDVCGKGFKQNKNLKPHLKTHSEHRPHKCDVCGKCFKEKRKLKIHLISHDEQKPHKCDICGKCFKEKGTLKTHLITHSEHRPHKCDVCGKGFILNSYLKSHLTSHSEHRYHKCDVCGKCFKKKGTLKSHLLYCSYAPKVSAEGVPLVVNATTKSRLPVVKS